MSKVLFVLFLLFGFGCEPQLKVEKTPVLYKVQCKLPDGVVKGYHTPKRRIYNVRGGLFHFPSTEGKFVISRYCHSEQDMTEQQKKEWGIK